MFSLNFMFIDTVDLQVLFNVNIFALLDTKENSELIIVDTKGPVT